jgi:hypothetical protein
MDGMMEGGGWFGNGMDDLKRRLTALPEELSVKSTLAKAIGCTIGHWDGLTMFLTDGRVEVDSNTVERTMRTIAPGQAQLSLRRVRTRRAQLSHPRLASHHGEAERRRSADLADRRAGAYRLGPNLRHRGSTMESGEE